MRFRLLVSWTWFFLVLFSYYVLKPVRDALATETRLFGPLYLATFLAVCAALPLYWRIVGRTTRWQLVFGVCQFFVACMVAFAVLLARGHGDAAWLRNAFFVWVWTVAAWAREPHNNPPTMSRKASSGNLLSVSW